MKSFRRFPRGEPWYPLPETEPRAVTLFELIVVVVVAAVLAVLLVLSTNFLVVRTKVSRVKEEQRVLVRALQNYQMDYSNLPTESAGLEALVAPTAYLASVPHDPFQRSEPDAAYFYFSPDGIGRSYAIVSAGPDGKLDVLQFLSWARGTQPRAAPGSEFGDSRMAENESDTAGQDPIPLSPETDWFHEYMARYTYDPTNGTVSSGDIISVVVNN